MRLYRAEETSRMQALDGVELADFWQRAGALVVDVVLAILVAITLTAISLLAFGHGDVETPFFNIHMSNTAKPTETKPAETQPGQHVTVRWGEASEIIVRVLPLVLYFGLACYWGNGRTPGKRVFRIRAVSLVHHNMSLWHSIERALGYGAAALEGGFGFIQFFIHPYRRTVQDRMAETIVVKEASYRAKLHSPL